MTENEANQSAEEQEKKVQSEIEETLAGPVLVCGHGAHERRQIHAVCEQEDERSSWND